MQKMRNLRFSKVWRITVSQSAADTGGQTWSPFSQSLIYFQSGDFALFLKRLWQCWKKLSNQVVPHACSTCTDFIANNGIKASSFSALYPLAQPVEGHTRGVSVTQFQSGHLTFHTGFLNGPMLSLSCDSFNLHILKWLHCPRWSRHVFLPTWVLLCGLSSLWLFHLFHWDGIRDFQSDFLMTNEELVIESCGVITFETLGSHLLSWVLCWTLQDKLAFRCFNKRVFNYLVSIPISNNAF